MEDNSGSAGFRVPARTLFRLAAGYLAVLFVMDASMDGLAVLEGRGPGGPLGFLTNATLWWGVWVPCLMAGMVLAQRVSPDETGWVKSIAANVGMSIVLVLVHVFVVATAFHFMWRGDTGPSIGWRMRHLGTTFLMPEFLTIWGAVALLYSYVIVNRLHARELEGVRLRAAMSEARLETLQREISPHFLFNALNSVGGLVRSDQSQLATDMLDALATLLRNSLDKDDRVEVRLDEEMYLLDQYVRVEKSRWGEALRVDMEMGEGLEAVAVPPLVLQPLVENAIRYGISDSGTVRVAATREGDDLILMVEDPGQGAGNRPPQGFGIGLANTRERLNCLYGPSSSLAVLATATKGTVVRISMPIRLMSEEGTTMTMRATTGTQNEAFGYA